MKLKQLHDLYVLVFLEFHGDVSLHLLLQDFLYPASFELRFSLITPSRIYLFERIFTYNFSTMLLTFKILIY